MCRTDIIRRQDRSKEHTEIDVIFGIETILKGPINLDKFLFYRKAVSEQSSTLYYR